MKGDLRRIRRLLRRIDLEEVLEDLGIEVEHYNGSDVYALCPDPDHCDNDPSFHVCVEDVTDRKGRERLGSFNCWSHGGDGLRSLNFADLVARVLFDIWVDSDGSTRWPNDADRDRAVAWIRKTYLNRDPIDFELVRKRVRRRRKRKQVEGELLFPPTTSLTRADPRFRIYLKRRGISLDRANKLGVTAVERTGRALFRTLSDTVPAVLFPIRWNGEVVNWYVRSICRRCKSSAKGRYAPKVSLAKRGVLWLPDTVDTSKPLVLVEGIFDAERVRSIIEHAKPSNLIPENVSAVLGGKLSEAQARKVVDFPMVIHLADGDAGGRALGKSIKQRVNDRTRVVSRDLPEGRDPGDLPEEQLLALLWVPVVERVYFRRSYRKSRRSRRKIK